MAENTTGGLAAALGTLDAKLYRAYEQRGSKCECGHGYLPHAGLWKNNCREPECSCEDWQEADG